MRNGSGFWQVLYGIWDIVVTFVLLVTLVTMPLGLGFEEINDQMFEFNLAVDCIFLLDLLKSFFTGVVTDDGEVKTGQLFCLVPGAHLHINTPNQARACSGQHYMTGDHVTPDNRADVPYRLVRIWLF